MLVMFRKDLVLRLFASMSKHTVVGNYEGRGKKPKASSLQVSRLENCKHKSKDTCRMDKALIVHALINKEEKQEDVIIIIKIFEGKFEDVCKAVFGIGITIS